MKHKEAAGLVHSFICEIQLHLQVQKLRTFIDDSLITVMIDWL